jgi:hypothetical protein
MLQRRTASAALPPLHAFASPVARRWAGCGAAAASQQSNAGLVASLKPPHIFDQDRSGAVEFRCDEWKAHMIHLYRVVLKSHEIYLEHEAQREFGDKFVKAEFRRHAMANAKYAAIFYKGWFEYVVQLELGQTSRALTAEETALLSEEQKERLQALRGHVLERRMEDGTAGLLEVEGHKRP